MAWDRGTTREGSHHQLPHNIMPRADVLREHAPTPRSQKHVWARTLVLTLTLLIPGMRHPYSSVGHTSLTATVTMPHTKAALSSCACQI